MPESLADCAIVGEARGTSVRANNIRSFDCTSHYSWPNVTDMPTHDPLINVRGLRDHLAAHDKPLAFLFGAGTSCAVKTAESAVDGPQKGEPLIPAIHQLTAKCGETVANLDERFRGAWAAIEQECARADLDPNVENMLSRVRMKLDAVGEEDTLKGLNRVDLQRMEKTITTTIARLAHPPEDCFPSETPHHGFASWIARIPRQKQPVEVFTTNYDVLVERALEEERCSFFDGFSGAVQPFFSITNEPFPSWTRLWKLHGSVNWGWATYPTGRRVVRVPPNHLGEMILPSHRKYDEARKQPYVALFDRLGHVLSQEDAIVVALGHSFGDAHVNTTILEALDRPRRTQLFALTFTELQEDHPLVQAAKRQPKISVFGPDTAIIRGQRGKWQLIEPINDKTAAFMDIAFDSDAAPDESTPSLTGRMRLGDFNSFCSFLASMDI